MWGCPISDMIKMPMDALTFCMDHGHFNPHHAVRRALMRSGPTHASTLTAQFHTCMCEFAILKVQHATPITHPHT